LNCVCDDDISSTVSWSEPVMLTRTFHQGPGPGQGQGQQLWSEPVMLTRTSHQGPGPGQGQQLWSEPTCKVQLHSIKNTTTTNDNKLRRTLSNMAGTVRWQDYDIARCRK